MLKNFDPVLLCPDCEIIRTSRSRHCSICNKCVERFDHHCPWINNCVGTRNHGYFMCFLMSVPLLLVLVIGTVSSVISVEFTNGTQPNDLCFLTVLPSEIYTQQVFVLACVLVLITSIFFILPVL